MYVNATAAVQRVPLAVRCDGVIVTASAIYKCHSPPSSTLLTVLLRAGFCLSYDQCHASSMVGMSPPNALEFNTERTVARNPLPHPAQVRSDNRVVWELDRMVVYTPAEGLESLDSISLRSTFLSKIDAVSGREYPQRIEGPLVRPESRSVIRLQHL